MNGYLVAVWLRPSLVAEELGSAMAQLWFSLGSAPVLDGTMHATGAAKTLWSRAMYIGMILVQAWFTLGSDWLSAAIATIPAGVQLILSR